MKVFIQSIFGQIILTSFIAWRGYQAVPSGKKWKVPYFLFFTLEFCLFMFGYIFRKDLPDDIMLPLMMICNTWYIASLYITMCIIAIEVLRFSDRFIHWIPVFVKRNSIAVKRILFLSVLVGVSILMVIANRTVTNPVVKHVYITLPKKGSTRDSLKIAMMTDLHIGEVIQKSMVQKYVALCNAEHPDMVVMVGDIMDYESRFAEKYHSDEDLQKLNAPLGSYIVNGNHEFRANINAKRIMLRKMGCLLIDSVVSPDSTFLLIGRDDFVNKNRKPLNEILKNEPHDLPTIVLDHQPYCFSEMRMNNIDLGLHGHTHNGQFWPYPLLMKFIYECPYGEYKNGPTQHYVSSGVGCAGPPYRVGTLSEIVILHLKFE